MNSNILSGNWKQISGEIKKQWSKLTDDDLKEIEGDKDKLLGVLEEKYGLAKDKAKEELNKFFEEHAEEFEAFKKKAGAFLENVSDQVKACFRDSPVTCVAVAAGVGLVLGMLLLR